MKDVHLVVGIVTIALNGIAGLYGAWLWWRVKARLRMTIVAQKMSSAREAYSSSAPRTSTYERSTTLGSGWIGTTT